MKPVYITDIIEEIALATQNATFGYTTNLLQTIKTNEIAALGSSLIEVIDFQHGHKRELIETLFQMDTSKTLRFKKYPLIYLVQDFAEEHGSEVGIYATVSLNIIIAHHTKSDYKIDDREAKVFKPVLYPIYYEFLNQLVKNKWIANDDDTTLRHRKTDRSYWGRQAVGGTDANKLQDFVDAIEIENLNLRINFKNC